MLFLNLAAAVAPRDSEETGNELRRHRGGEDSQRGSRDAYEEIDMGGRGGASDSVLV